MILHQITKNGWFGIKPNKSFLKFGSFGLMAYQTFWLFDTKSILVEEKLWYYLPISWTYNLVHICS